MRQPGRTYRGALLEVMIEAETTMRLKKFCAERGSTLFMGLLSVVNILLYRYSGQEDIVVGSPIAGRDHADLEDQIGFYVNTLALRTRFAAGGSDSFETLLGRVRQVTLEAYEHQSYPFDEPLDELQLKRDVSRNPLFDVMVVLQNAGSLRIESQTMGSVQVSHYEVNNPVSKFDLSFDFFEEEDNRLLFAITYNPDLYEAGTVSRMSSHFMGLLSGCLSSPGEAVGRLDYLSAEERRELLGSFNGAQVSYPRHKTVVDLFEEQAARTPHHAAVVFGSRVLTYEELNALSNQLGAYLRSEYGLEADDLAGVMLGRSEWMIVAILGILKSGAAYVPVDPDYPPERRAYMTSDSGCRVVVDEAELERFRGAQAGYSTANLSPVSRPDSLAYVIYTSGTTGQPKGVMIEHRNVCARAFYFQRMYSVSKADNYIFYRSSSFDGAIEEYLFPILSGAVCYVVTADFRENLIENLFTFISTHSITKVNMPPVLLQEVVAMTNEEILKKVSSLRHIVSGGDKLAIGIVKAYFSKFKTNLYNTYGPTENTIDSTNWLVQPDTEKILIGKPIDNSSVYILDSNYQLVPIGVYGEIFVGGEGLSRGYLNRPELTEQRFIFNP